MQSFVLTLTLSCCTAQNPNKYENDVQLQYVLICALGFFPTHSSFLLLLLII